LIIKINRNLIAQYSKLTQVAQLTNAVAAVVAFSIEAESFVALVEFAEFLP
jgi:hypothetical protein